jgi:hypothetical protein
MRTTTDSVSDVSSRGCADPALTSRASIELENAAFAQHFKGSQSLRQCHHVYDARRCELHEGHALPHRADMSSGLRSYSWTRSDNESLDRPDPALRSGLPARLQLVTWAMFQPLIVAMQELVAVAAELVAKHIYLNPRSPESDEKADAFCAHCLRGGLNFREIDHTESCLVGRVAQCLRAAAPFLSPYSAKPTSSERTSAGSSEAPTKQEDAAAEGQSRFNQPLNYDSERSIVHLGESFARRRSFNPYTHPCPGINHGFVCQLEEGHTGAHCNDGSVWADDGRRFA